MTQLDPDWQVYKTCIKERTAVLFNNELLADVHFKVGSRSTLRIPAHKLILATGSPVFYAMFYGGLAEDKKEVAIPDVEPQAFLNMLQWVYSRTIKTLTMMTSSNGNIFRVTGHLCGEFTGPRWIPRTKTSAAELWCFLWSAPDKWLNKLWRGWWFETPSCPLWLHCNAKAEVNVFILHVYGK